MTATTAWPKIYIVDVELKMGGLSSDRDKFFGDVVANFSTDEPLCLSRIGGSDTDALIDYLSLKQDDENALDLHVKRHLPVVESYNGFYDLKGAKDASYFRYLNELHSCYLSMRMCTFVHTHFISTFFPNAINEAFFKADVPNRSTMKALVKEIADSDEFIGGYPYLFVEDVIKRSTLFRAFTNILQGKSVLVLCPFGDSIHVNFRNRHSFFVDNYVYPEFKLITVNTPITYSGMDANMYPHASWFDTVDALKTQLRGENFDIALMACGSYAMPLGRYIERELQRKAIYVGGILQLYFGIMGRRYENPFFLNQINREHFIQPVERAKYLALIPTGDLAAREAFGAYF